MLPATSRCVLVAVLIVTLPMAVYGSGKASVRGAEVVNVRQAPSTGSPVLLSLPKGREVTVEKVVGDWAVITLAGGRRGYIRTIYLALPTGIEVVAGPPATVEISPRVLPAVTPPRAASWSPTPPPTVSAMPTQTPATAGTPSADAEAPGGTGLQREVAELRHRLAALESAVVATQPGAPAATREGSGPTPPATVGEPEPTRAQVFAPTVAQLPNPEEIGPSLAMAGVGLVIGFLLGGAYGRRQERNRRTRVRF